MLKLWNDDAGYILSAESVFLFTIAVLGVTVGMAQVRNATVSELAEVANAISSLNQTYSFNGLTCCAGWVNGSATINNVTPNLVSQIPPLVVVPINAPLNTP
jgi:hypothetical protein